MSLLLLLLFLHVAIFLKVSWYTCEEWSWVTISLAGEYLFTLCISITVTVLSQEFVVISSSYFCYLLSAFYYTCVLVVLGPAQSIHKYIIWSSMLYNAKIPVFSSLLAINQIKSSTLRTFLCYDQYWNFQQKTLNVP